MTLTLLAIIIPRSIRTEKDDYILIGKQIPYAPPVYEQFTAGNQSHFTAMEAGYVRNRHLLAGSSSPTNVEGVLVVDHEGYYTPRLRGQKQGIVVPQITAIASASLLAPTPWPYSPTTGTTGQQAAYTWISNQICCQDIQAAFINLNVSPAIWLTQSAQLSLSIQPVRVFQLSRIR